MEQILIVEDDSFLNKMLDYNLTADGYGVTSALNARTAAEAIRQREFNFATAGEDTVVTSPSRMEWYTMEITSVAAAPMAPTTLGVLLVL